jgi:adenine deaminase
MKFRKKPVVIEAMRFTYPPTPALLAWCPALKNWRCNRHLGAIAEADIVTLEDGSDGRAKHVASAGDWIIKGVQGEFYPCKPDIFAATYEAV